MSTRTARVARVESLAPTLLLCVAFLIALARMSDAWDKSFDDSYITYLYGKHLEAGLGLRYNASDAAPVEGFSSLLHVLIAAAAYRLGIDPLTATRALGPLSLLLVALSWARVWTRRDGLPRGAALIGASCFATIIALLPEMRFHLSGGMETMLFAAVAGLAHVWYWDVLSSKQLSYAQVAIGLTLIAGLLIGRPEGVIVAGAMVAALWARHCFVERSLYLPAPLLALGLGAAALLVGLVAWKLAYFGDWAPLPYYVKSHNALYGSAGVALPGLREVIAFVGLRLLPAAMLVLAVLTIPRGAEMTRLALFLVPAAISVLAYTRVIHEVAYGFRYEFPYLWPVLALVGLGIARHVAVMHRAQRSLGLRALAAAAGLAVVFGSIDRHSPPWTWLKSPLAAATDWTREPDGGVLHSLALDLRASGVEDALIATSAAGLIPLASGWSALDVIGLNDAALSGKNAMTPEEAFEYINGRRADVFMSIYPPASRGSTNVHDEPLFQQPIGQRAIEGPFNELYRYWDRNRVAEMLYREMALVRDHYEFGAAYPIGGTWFVIAYVRSDSPHRARVLHTLQSSERVDKTSDLTAYYVNDPRELGRDVTAHDEPRAATLDADDLF